MIYKAVQLDEPIRQGDIFKNVPNVEFSLVKLPVIEEAEPEEMSWQDVVASGDQSPITAIVAIQPVIGIVMTQDCDAARGEHICLAQIGDYVSSSGITAPTSPKKWQRLITEHSRTQLRLFYLPLTPALAFSTARLQISGALFGFHWKNFVTFANIALVN